MSKPYQLHQPERSLVKLNGMIYQQRTSDSGKALPHPKRPTKHSTFRQYQTSHIHSRKDRARIASGLSAMRRPRKGHPVLGQSR